MEFEQNQLSHTIRLCNQFIKSNDNAIAKKLKSTFELLCDFRIISETEEAKLPCHINLVDLLRANEPAHSKILDGLFSLRNINADMNKELQEFLKKEMGLDQEPGLNHKKIEVKIADIDNLRNHLLLLKDETERQCWADWLGQLRRDYPDYRIIDYTGIHKLTKVGIILNYRGHRFSALIESNSNTNKIYYGFGRHDTSNTLIPEVINFLPSVMGKCGLGGQDDWWYGWRYTSFEEGFDLLKKAIDEAIFSLGR